ncbi:MAG TPA: hypothetical protein VLU92_04060 [Candidatus Dormibacteraeota bacterium]|nr:hypothetical protein [Candidatus Dormibacteraeota bacterium]
MITAAKVLGVVGGALALIGAIAALIIGGADTVIVGGWVTVAAAIVGIFGGALAGARPGLAALLMALAAAGATLVAPGVIPAIADSTVVFLGYLAAGVFLAIGAVLAFRGRKRVPTRNLTELSH